MFWNVTFIYNAFVHTTDHCKVQTAFVSLFYIFINMKPLNIHYPGTRRVVKNYPGSLLPGYPTGTRVPVAALNSGI